MTVFRFEINCANKGALVVLVFKNILKIFEYKEYVLSIGAFFMKIVSLYSFKCDESSFYIDIII